MTTSEFRVNLVYTERSRLVKAKTNQPIRIRISLIRFVEFESSVCPLGIQLHVNVKIRRELQLKQIWDLSVYN